MSACEELYRRHSGRLYNVAYRMTGNAADAEDLVQDTLLRAFRGFDGFTAGTNTLRVTQSGSTTDVSFTVGASDSNETVLSSLASAIASGKRNVW